MRSQQVSCLLVLAVKLGLIASHVMWTCPTPRAQDSFLKQGPCGGPGFGTITDTPQYIVSPGYFTMIFQETVFHPGAPFRIALSQPGVDNFEECILLNHIPHNDAGAAGDSYAITVQIPDFNCSYCSLQIIEVMTDKIGANLPGATSCTYNPNDTTDWTGGQCGSNYHSCVNVQINGTQPWNSNMCVQPSGWNMGGQKYVYGSESGTWTSGVLTDSRAPPSVRTIAAGTLCASQISSTKFTNPNISIGLVVGILIFVVGIGIFMSFMFFVSRRGRRGYTKN
jgi:hypothetical protein